MKAVLLSVKPKWCEMFASGKKTIEVRKSAPKEVPFKGYIYCANHGIKYCHTYVDNKKMGHSVLWNGKVIGEFICDKVYKFESEFWDDNTFEQIKCFYESDDPEDDPEDLYFTVGVNGEFTEGFALGDKTCLTWQELRKYVGQDIKTFYGWHISDLKIYDKPRELGEFYTICNKYGDDSCEDCPYLAVEQCSFPCDDCVDTWCSVDNIKPITRPPRDWQYVEKLQ